MVSAKPRVVIIGGGFGGLYAAQVLGRNRYPVTLIDKRNFHLFQPLLYQVATGSLSPGDIAIPLRTVLARYPTIRVIEDECTDLDPVQKRVIMKNGELPYDRLIQLCPLISTG